MAGSRYSSLLFVGLLAAQTGDQAPNKAQQSNAQLQQAPNWLVSAVEFVGKVSGVQTRLDTYKDFQVVALETLKPQQVHPDQLQLLKADSKFNGKTAYLITAIQEQPNGEFNQRRFIMNEEQAKKIGLDTTESDKRKERVAVPLGIKITTKTHGQYLESFMGSNFAKIYPMVQEVEATRATFDEVNRLKSGMISGKIDSGFYVSMYGNTKSKPQTPNP